MTISPSRLRDVPLQTSARKGCWLEADDLQTVKALHQRKSEQSDVRSYIEDDVAITDGHTMSLVTPVFENLSKDETDLPAASGGAPDAKTVRATKLFHRQSMQHRTQYQRLLIDLAKWPIAILRASRMQG